MKKIILLGALMGLSSIANAQFTEEPKITRDLSKLISPYKTYSVETVKAMPDEVYVTLEGYITQRSTDDNEKYTFEDESGSLMVEIDNELWKGQHVSKTTKVKILGETDKSIQLERFKIDVIYLEVLDK